MPRWEVRFYDALDRVKLCVELDAADRPGAEYAARLYVADVAPMRLATKRLVLGVVKELS